MSFPWSQEDAPAQKGKKQARQANTNNIFGNDDAPVARKKTPLQPASYNIISGDNAASFAASKADRQPRKAQWSANDYIVHKGKGAVSVGQSPFESQNQNTSIGRFVRAPKCGDQGYDQSSYRNGMAAAKALRTNTQQTEAGACIFGN